MSGSRDENRDVDEQVPDAVMRWLRSMADEGSVSEAELLQSLLAGRDPSGGDAGGGIDWEDLDRVEREFQELVEDVRDRVVQVKREADGKAPAEHSHPELRSTVEQIDRDVDSVKAELGRIERSVEGGFENYEEILTYLTEATDTLDRRLGRVASAVISLREGVGDASTGEAGRTALAHLKETANRQGVERAKCEECGEGVHVGMLIQPRCPHCDTSFTSLEPKGGFFRKSVLHTGTRPALESGTEDVDDEVGALEAIVEAGQRAGERTPTFDLNGVTDRADEETAEPQSVQERQLDARPEAEGARAEPDPADIEEGTPGIDGHRDLEDVDSIGPADADRLEAAGIDDLLSLAVADPEQLGDEIGVPETTVAEWVAQADAMTSTG